MLNKIINGITGRACNKIYLLPHALTNPESGLHIAHILGLQVCGGADARDDMGRPRG